MNRCISRFLQLLMLVSLLAMPSQTVAGPIAQACPAKMACCGPNCPCPTGKTCVAAPSPIGDRAIGQVQPQVSGRGAVVLYTLLFKPVAPALLSVKLASWDAKPPPLAIGSAPQAKLRVWLL